MPKRIVVTDSQRLSTTASCGRKFEYSFIRNNVPVLKEEYFERGDLLHKMLQTYYTLRKYRTRWITNGRTHADIVNSCVIAGRHLALHMQIDVDEVESVVRTFMEYANHFADDGWDQIKAVEQIGSKLLYDSEDLAILYEVKIDLVLVSPGIGTLPVDHKSSSQRKEPSDLSNQFMGYCWFLGTNHLTVNKIGFQKTLKPNEKFQRYLLSYTNNRLEEWREEAIWWTKKGLEYIDSGYFPRNLTSCDKYSGCIFQHVCASDPIVRETKLRQSFEQRTKQWDPGASI